MKLKTIGADPEFFLIDRKTKSPIPAIGLIGGTKSSPIMITDKGHGLQEDNVMVEYCIPPSQSLEEFIHHNNFMINKVKSMIPDNLEICIESSLRFDNSFLKHPQASEFGCDPDFNIWKMSPNDSPNSSTDLRTSGGHIHIGLEDYSEEDLSNAIKSMDLFLGVPSIVMDKDIERRKMYGKAGSFRVKDYGFEYRTLSNFWIKNDKLMKWAFENSNKAISEANNLNISSSTGDKIQKCINESNVDLARELIKEFKLEVIETSIKTNIKETINI